jgi:hypothetical protein
MSAFVGRSHGFGDELLESVVLQPPMKMTLIRQAQKATHGIERNPRSVENLDFIQAVPFIVL